MKRKYREKSIKRKGECLYTFSFSPIFLSSFLFPTFDNRDELEVVSLDFIL